MIFRQERVFAEQFFCHREISAIDRSLLSQSWRLARLVYQATSWVFNRSKSARMIGKTEFGRWKSSDLVFFHVELGTGFWGNPNQDPGCRNSLGATTFLSRWRYLTSPMVPIIFLVVAHLHYRWWIRKIFLDVNIVMRANRAKPQILCYFSF